jgi:hypothetical protein
LFVFAFQISSAPSSLKMRIMIGELRSMPLADMSARMRLGSGCSTLFLTVERSIPCADSNASLQPVRASAMSET